MDKNTFKKILVLHREQSEMLDSLSDLINFDHPLIDNSFKFFDALMKEAFNIDQIDWINWWLYERIDMITGEELPYYDEDNNAHYMHTIEDLWDYINKLK